MQLKETSTFSWNFGFAEINLAYIYSGGWVGDQSAATYNEQRQLWVTTQDMLRD